MVTIIIAGVFLLLYLARKAKRIMYLRNDENFKDGVKWPKWLIDDCNKWNEKNPHRFVKPQE